MDNLICRIIVTVRNFVCLLFGLVVITIATLEFIFAPMILIKYYIPGIMDYGTKANILIIFTYAIFIAIQVLNILASILLFFSIFITGFHDKYIAYDTVMIVSISLSVAIIGHKLETNTNLYESIIEREIYIQTSRVGDWICQTPPRNTFHGRNHVKANLQCTFSDIYHWHQINRCCGWSSPNDLAGLITFNSKLINSFVNKKNTNINKTGNDNVGIISKKFETKNSNLLPDFCCTHDFHQFFVSMEELHYRYPNKQQNHCTVTSSKRFNQTCRSKKRAFLSLKSLSLVSHPMDYIYIIIKLIGTLSYTFTKNHMLPQAEGPFTFFISP